MTTPTPGAAGELLPCNCGGDAARNTPATYWIYGVHCTKCRNEVCGFESQKEADAAWNRVTTPPSPVEGAQREAVAGYPLRPADFAMASRALKMLRENPWPSGDPAWSIIEHWLEGIARASNPAYAPPPPDRVQPERGEALAIADKIDRITRGASSNYRFAGAGRSLPIPDNHCITTWELLVAAAALREYAPPTDASGGVTEAMVDAAMTAPVGNVGSQVSDFIVTSDEATIEEILGAALEAADRARTPAPQGRSNFQIRRNEDGTLDEVIGTGRVHLEQMDSSHWWLGFGDDPLLHINLHARGKIKATVLDERTTGATTNTPSAPTAPSPQRYRQVTIEDAKKIVDLYHQSELSCYESMLISLQHINAVVPDTAQGAG